MAFAKDLLQQAFLLLNKESKNPKQASLRLAVSTAYYALFHLLIHEASANWSRVDTRVSCARIRAQDDEGRIYASREHHI
jgi:hypothetical protein